MRISHLILATCLAAMLLLSPTPALAEGEATATPTARPTEHVVQRGEYLAGIAVRYGVTVEQLAAANSIANPRLIHAGVRLRIPGPGEPVVPPVASTPQPAQPVPDPPQPGPAGATYVVRRGDSLTLIASRYGVTPAELATLNSLANPSLIHAGMVLVLPAGAASSVPLDGRPVPTVTEGKQIVVVLSQQKLYAFDNGDLAQEFLISSGLAVTPTLQGDFAVYRHVRSQLMRGSDYYLPNVQWVMYYFRDYAIHGAYWHSNFGQPMSHGCVNMREEDAQWLYEWSPDGTSVWIIE